MIKLFTRREMIPLILILAVGGLGFWIGVNQGGAEIMKLLAVLLLGLALLLASASALAHRS